MEWGTTRNRRNIASDINTTITFVIIVASSFSQLKFRCFWIKSKTTLHLSRLIGNYELDWVKRIFFIRSLTRVSAAWLQWAIIKRYFYTQLSSSKPGVSNCHPTLVDCTIRDSFRDRVETLYEYPTPTVVSRPEVWTRDHSSLIKKSRYFSIL